MSDTEARTMANDAPRESHQRDKAGGARSMRGNGRERARQAYREADEHYAVVSGLTGLHHPSRHAWWSRWRPTAEGRVLVLTLAVLVPAIAVLVIVPHWAH